MPTNDTNIGLAGDLTDAIDKLQTALQTASDATATIRTLVPRVAATSSLFDELEAVIRSGRGQLGAPPAQDQPVAIYPRPTLVAPNGTHEPAREPWGEPSQSHESSAPSAVAIATEPSPAAKTNATESLTCFRLEFESTPGPLDLRTVDDAVSEHPDVRDVALLDYDGHKATLKVWIVATAKPEQVQESLTERATQLFGTSNEVSVVALEDVA